MPSIIERASITLSTAEGKSFSLLLAPFIIYGCLHVLLPGVKTALCGLLPWWLWLAVAAVWLGVAHHVRRGNSCPEIPNMVGKTVIVTGANTGIGKETAYELAVRGAHVIMACRTEAKAQKAIAELKERGKAKNSTMLLEFMPLRLDSLASVKSFASSFLARDVALDILINNAGIMTCPYAKTEDGYESQFGVNHLGHFCLTTELLPAIKRASGRVVSVASLAHIGANGIALEKNADAATYDRVNAYAQSKLANILFTRELQRRFAAEGSNCLAVCLHPGVVNTELCRHLPVINVIGSPFLALLFKSPSMGAQTTLTCATSPNIVGGAYYADCHPAPSTHASKSVAAAKALWEISVSMVARASSQ